MAVDNLFQNRNYTAQVGDVLADNLPAGTYMLRAGQLPPGISVSEDGTVSGTPTSAGIYTVTMEFCCE